MNNKMAVESSTSEIVVILLLGVIFIRVSIELSCLNAKILSFSPWSDKKIE